MAANRTYANDKKRFVLKAAAYDNIESPEEQEAFEVMTDTAPQQFESLSEPKWKNGDECTWKGKEAKIIGPMPSHPSRMIVEAQDALGAHVKVARAEDLIKPETPEQRAERERLEAAYSLYYHAQQSVDVTSCDDFVAFKSDAVQVKFWLSIVDKTGYRK